MARKLVNRIPALSPSCYWSYGESGAIRSPKHRKSLVPIEDLNVLRVQPINKFGTAVEIVGLFGGREKYLEAVRELETLIYSPAA